MKEKLELLSDVAKLVGITVLVISPVVAYFWIMLGVMGRLK
jgi:hypothetical protein